MRVFFQLSNKFQRIIIKTLLLILAIFIGGNSNILAQDFVVGYGAAAWNFDNKEVVHVTNLNDSGPGSLRDAVSQPNRIVLFDVGGKIILSSTLRIEDNIILAAFTAPGDYGIVTQGTTLNVSGSNIAIVGLKHWVQGSGDTDGIFTSGPSSNIIIAHCSTLYAVDEGLTSNGNRGAITNLTYAYNISESLNAGHSKGPHAMGGMQSKNNATNGTWLGNIFANNLARNPRIEGGRADVINNVVYNWSSKGIEVRGVFETTQANVMNNYIKRGPTTSPRPGSGIDLGASEVYVAGNSDNLVNHDNEYAISTLRSTPLPIDYPIDIMSAEDAYEYVLDNAGWKNSALEEKVIEQVRTGTGSQIYSVSELGGYPDIASTSTTHVYTDIEEYLLSFFDGMGEPPTPVNNAPSIDPITSKSITENEVLGPVTFFIGDVETPAGDLTVSAVSSNTGLVQDQNIVLGGSGSNRTFTITPEADQTGTSTITITVSDGEKEASTSFVLTVNPPVNNPPTVSNISNQTIIVNNVLGPIDFTVGDVETPAEDLVVTAFSSNLALVRSSGIVITGSGANRTLTVTPIADQFGNTSITINVSDGVNVASEIFVLTVLEDPETNTSPTISDIPNQSVDQGDVMGPIDFVIGDAETASGDLVVTASSNNQTLVPDSRIALGGSGDNRTVTIEPTLSEFGSTLITITVSDGDKVAVDNFTLTVNEVSGGDNPPFIPIMPEETVEMNQTLGPIAFTVSDPDTDVNTIDITADANNKTLIPDENITIGGSGANRTITIIPATDQVGSTPVSIVAFDGVNKFTRTLTVHVVDNSIRFSVSVEDADCNENNGAINMSVSGGEAPYSFSWSNGATTESIDNLGVGTYSLTVTDNNGSQRTASFVVGGVLPPEQPVISQDGNELSTTSDEENIQWYMNGVAIDGATESTLTIEESADYTVEVFSLEGCSTLSEIFSAEIEPILSTDIQSLQIFPNPVSDEMTIDLNLNSTLHKVGIAIFTIDGRPVFKKWLKVSSRQQIRESFNLLRLKPGVYLVKIKVNQEVVVRRIIKQ